MTTLNLRTSPKNVAMFTFDKVNNGFIVTVGSRIFVSNKWSEVSKGLGKYWEDP